MSKKMVGQERVIRWLDSVSDDAPKFIIFVAPRGCGKRMLAKYLAHNLGATYAPCGVKVEEVRDVINASYTVQDKMLYCFEDADTMRAEAKNAMLKVTEEPPKNAYFAMTVEDDSSLLDTIKSRGYVVALDPYSVEDIRNYIIQSHPDFSRERLDTIANIASCPREAELMITYGDEFMDYVELVVDNIGEVASANSFKSSSKLALKNEEDKYDLKVFWNAFILVCLKRVTSDPLHYARGIDVTTPFLKMCDRLGVNKSQLYDNWVFEIREVWA